MKSMSYFRRATPSLHPLRLLPRLAHNFHTSPRCYSSYPSPATNSTSATPRKKTTLTTLNKLYKKNEPITVMTAHDYPTGVFVDKAGIDMCLVGDSLAMVALGYENTNRITMDEMLHHCRAVARGAHHPFLVGDLPFGTYETSASQALASSIRMIQDGHMEAVKLEGGIELAETIHKITSVGIPVLGHVGLTPQRATSLGGFRVQGKTAARAEKLLEDAIAVQEAGAFAIVLEAIPEVVATELTNRLKIPTIGIGAGAGCSGQVLVMMDAFGIYDKMVPKFCKTYAEVGKASVTGLQDYIKEVKERSFPASGTHTYPMEKGEDEKFLDWIENNPK